MSNLLKGDSGKFVMAALAVIAGLIIFSVWVEKASWYAKLKTKA